MSAIAATPTVRLALSAALLTAIFASTAFAADPVRTADGCSTGYILYDASYDIPSIGFHQRALTSVTYVHEGGRWLSIADQGTLLP